MKHDTKMPKADDFPVGAPEPCLCARGLTKPAASAAPTGEGQTVSLVLHLLTSAIARLSAAGVPDPKWDAEELLEWAGGPDRSHLFLTDLQDLPAEVPARFEEGIGLREKRIPLQQIIGRTWFMGLPFRVTEQVLCPRPDTECLVERALEILKARGIDSPLILDLCCGSGCIGIALAHYLPKARLVLSDLSEEALALARENAALNGVSERIQFARGDMLEAVLEDTGERIKDLPYDLICCNPPYIPGDEIESLMPEVKDHEPRLALDGGRDGLDFYRRLAADSGGGRWVAAPTGFLLLEIGCEQGEAVREMFENAGWENITIHKDLAGLDRVVMIL